MLPFNETSRRRVVCNTENRDWVQSTLIASHGHGIDDRYFLVCDWIPTWFKRDDMSKEERALFFVDTAMLQSNVFYEANRVGSFDTFCNAWEQEKRRYPYQIMGGRFGVIELFALVAGPDSDSDCDRKAVQS